jgi:hypothetical protein
MSYTANSYDATTPTDGVIAETATSEFRTLKNRLNTSTFDLTFVNLVGAPSITPNIGAALSGVLAFPAGQSGMNVVASACIAGSVILLQMRTLDATMTQIVAFSTVPGGFNVTGNATCTGIVSFYFLIWNSAQAPNGL